MFGFSASLLLRLLRPSGNKYLRLHFGGVSPDDQSSLFAASTWPQYCALMHRGRAVLFLARSFVCPLFPHPSSTLALGSRLPSPPPPPPSALSGAVTSPPLHRPKGVEEAGGRAHDLFSAVAKTERRRRSTTLYAPLPLLVRKEFSTLYSPSLATSTC